MTKSELRREMRRQKAAHSADELQSLSAQTVAHLVATGLWQQSRTVLLYHSLPDEVCTHDLVRQALDGRTVLLPQVVGDDLVLRRYGSDDDLAMGAFRILEPTGPLFEDYDAIDLAVVPGMAFTADGKRLGRGRGYYDRLLPRLRNATKLGLCWPFQLVAHIPTLPHDILMDTVVC